MLHHTYNNQSLPHENNLLSFYAYGNVIVVII